MDADSFDTRKAKDIFESDARIMLVVHYSDDVMKIYLRDGRRTSMNLKASRACPAWTALGERGEVIEIKD